MRVEFVVCQQSLVHVREQRARDATERVRSRRWRDASRRPDEHGIVERLPHLAQGHADCRLAHAQVARRAADTELIVEGERDGQQIQIEFVRDMGHLEFE
jgi:hypothetical protein